MAKKKTAYVCTECGADQSKWQGQCPACGQWNTLQEFTVSASKGAAASSRMAGYAGSAGQSGVVKLAEVDLAEMPRFSSGLQEFDRVLGGGLVPGSAILIGGHPGAGKSTLLLQTLCHLAKEMPALYVTGEESLQQVALRARRLGLPTDQLNMLSETNVERLTQQFEQHKPRIVVIDSIHHMLQHLGPGQSTVFGDVADEKQHSTGLLGIAG